MTGPARRLALGLATLCIALASTACTSVQAWERSKLAHPTMSSSSFAGPAADHVYSVQEGAVGGGAAAASGCGCN